MLAILAIAFANAMSFAQTKVPDAVTAAFKQKFSHASKVQWDKENSKEYEAEFETNGVSYSANFSNTGAWLETESPTSFSQLPSNVKQAFNTGHKGAVVKSVSKIETSKGVNKYELEVKKGVSTIEYFYNNRGQEIKE